MSSFMNPTGLPLSGGTLTGGLTLPSNGLTVGGTQLVASGGTVTASGLTLGTSNPVSTISVALLTDITKSITITVSGSSFKLLAVPG